VSLDNSKDNVLFSKEKNSYATANEEEWFECLIDAQGRLDTSVVVNGADLF
jgi:hypothetical protein